ncbi:MAG: flavocytochrome c [Deltaproteobacteria bacterium HGW-Deltaproteobacteria-12]|jgi:flavocytochrome c|nr:MAG: flavocytochrome c [Deltaproteobacteria bacterium HGW-Deltaproteobacteria-12]
MKEDKKLTKALSRRNFLKTAGGAAAVAGLATTGMALTPWTAEAACTTMPKKWDETYDVVVVGSGFAGLAAAYEAKKAGASVVVLEKMRTPGGNSIINGGVVSAAGSPMQEKEGIKDSPELMFKDMLAAGLQLNHPELAKMAADRSNTTVQWTINELGVKYKDKLTQEGGHSVPRMYSTHNQSGSAIVQQQLLKLKELGVVPKMQSFLTQIYRDSDGRVKGVQIREKYIFPNADSGKIKNIKARKAVVMATGGFGNDVAFRTIQDPRLTAEFPSTNQPGATAESHREALRIGCTPIQLSWIQLGPWGSPDEKGMGLSPFFAQLCAAMYGLWVDTKTGKRFVNELADRKIRADAIIRVGNKCIAFTDAFGYSLGEKLIAEAMPVLIERGVVKKYATLEDMAAGYNCPIEPLKQTVETFNKGVLAGKDAEWGRYLQKNQKPLGPGPWYALRLTPKIHHCMGGVNINAKAQAMDVVTDKPIPGLYAAGEFAGGVHGAVRLGSAAVIDCLVFGRVAGQNAAADKAWS